MSDLVQRLRCMATAPNNLTAQAADEIIKLRCELTYVRVAAQAVIDRWDSPDWKDAKHTGDYIHQLREAMK